MGEISSVEKTHLLILPFKFGNLLFDDKHLREHSMMRLYQGVLGGQHSIINEYIHPITYPKLPSFCPPPPPTLTQLLTVILIIELEWPCGVEYHLTGSIVCFSEWAAGGTGIMHTCPSRRIILMQSQHFREHNAFMFGIPNLLSSLGNIEYIWVTGRHSGVNK